MPKTKPLELDVFMAGLRRRNPTEREFHQAVYEVAESVIPFINEHPEYRDAQVLERLTEPDRIIVFRVCWEDDDGCVRVNRAWRVQFSNALGPYKGGLRFHHTVTQSVLKFLGFEQIFKNSLTGLPMGGAKGGANFNPHGKSEREIMRFCQALMLELHRHIGDQIDVPAGDIGVGGREIGYLFGHYMRIENRWTGVLTGKGYSSGGSAVRKEATGYGAVYFLENMLEHHEQKLEGKRIAISGSGNVALYAAEKALEEGAKVITLSDSDGTVVIEHGLTTEHLERAKQIKEVERGRIRELAEAFGEDMDYLPGKKPWSVPCDIAMPCATQNEIGETDAKHLVENGARVVVEGANMPSTAEAVEVFRKAGLLFAPGKAANAGGVGVSGLEISQNLTRVSWPRAVVDRRLRKIMRDIHERCVEHGNDSNGQIDYVRGANLAGFIKVADALLAYGVV